MDKNYCFYNFVMMKNYRMSITICEKKNEIE